jgi:predicted alpha/beta-hydrolase family hydrolase
MRAWAERLSTLGDVRPFDYPYQRAGKKRPDPLPKLIAAHREALEEARREAKGPIVLCGKSMGSRVGCHLSLETPVSGLICLGYPLKAAATGALRDQVLLELQAPILFVQGTRDSLCPLALLEPVLPRMRAPHRLETVQGGDHSLTVPKRGPLSQDEANAQALGAIAEFLVTLTARNP